jgi:pyridoxamine 5'-phosphate oxidase
MQIRIENLSDNLEKDIWLQLQRASVDKHHEWRCPVLITNGLDAFPDGRTVILRAVDIANMQLHFYTDSRSPKITQLLANPHALLVFWSKRLNWQLRVKVEMQVITAGELLQATWQQVKQSPSANDYLGIAMPGTPLNALSQIKQPYPHYFCMLNAQVISIDWLALNRSGHQRATIDASGVILTTP